MWHARLLPAILLTASCYVALGQHHSGEEILTLAEQNFQSIKDYSVTLDIVADIEQVKVPPMHVTMYYKQPDKVHFDSRGFALLPRDGMGLQFGQLTRCYVVDSVAVEDGPEHPVYRLALHPRDDKAVVRRIFMWIDGHRWTPERMLLPQPDGRMIDAQFTYEALDRLWLPTRLVVSFSMAQSDTAAAALPSTPFARALPNGPRATTRKGTVTVQYSAYHVNVGLPDSLFTSDNMRSK